MKILISKNAYKPYLKEWAGKWLEVDIKLLFDNQYNTDNGLRVLDVDIDAVKDDIRHGRGSCQYCGAQFERGKECNCDKKYHKYFNSYFMQYPDGMKNKLVHVPDRCKVGTYFFSIATDEKNVLFTQ